MGSVESASKLGCYAGGTFVGSLEEPLSAEVAQRGPFDAVISVGVLSYVHNYNIFWKEVLRMLVPGGWLVATHRYELWTGNEDGVQTHAAQHVVDGEWTCESVSERMPYMPLNPD